MNTCLCASVYEGALEQAVSGCGSENYGSSRDIGAGMSLAVWSCHSDGQLHIRLL